VGDVFCTVTGDTSVIREEHFAAMKDGAIVCNSGHFNVEIDIEALQRSSKRVRKEVRANVDEYVTKDGRSIFLVAEGRLVNLAAAEGHPASVMDMSFAVQALASEWAAKGKIPSTPRVHAVPPSIDSEVARLKLETMGVKIDVLTPAQVKYLSSWQEGT
jgi:adenosylhomocysteinase